MTCFKIEEDWVTKMQMAIMNFMIQLMLEWGVQIIITFIIVYYFDKLNRKYPDFRVTLGLKRLLSHLKHSEMTKSKTERDLNDLMRNMEDDFEVIFDALNVRFEQNLQQLEHLKPLVDFYWNQRISKGHYRDLISRIIETSMKLRTVRLEISTQTSALRGSYDWVE